MIRHCAWGFGMALFCVMGAWAAGLELDRPPAWNQKPYSPEDGSLAAVNPPPFTWVPPADDLRYIIEVSRTPDFSGDVIRREDVPVSTLALTAALAPGAWHWRYGVKSAAGDVQYSKVRSFTVPADAPRRPYPDMAAALHRIPQQRPRLFILPDQLASYRERAARGDLREAAARQKRYGSNLLKPRKKSGNLTLLIGQFKSPIIIVVPGDCLILQSKDSLINEATLTGENFPVEKPPGITAKKEVGHVQEET